MSLLFKLLLCMIYCQMCPNDHHYKRTTCLRRPTLSLPKPIPIQSFLYKTTTFLTQLVTTFLAPKWKTNLPKTITLNLQQTKKCKTMHINYLCPWRYLFFCYIIMVYQDLQLLPPTFPEGSRKFEYYSTNI